MQRERLKPCGQSVGGSTLWGLPSKAMTVGLVCKFGLTLGHWQESCHWVCCKYDEDAVICSDVDVAKCAASVM